jgi:hypothetical protein
MYTIYPGGKNVSADGEQKELFFENRPGTKFGSGDKIRKLLLLWLHKKSKQFLGAGVQPHALSS